MLRLLVDEVRKLKRSWILLGTPALFLTGSLLGVLTARANSLRDPDRIVFDLPTVFTQVQLDSSLLITPLILGLLAVSLAHREFQERTLISLLTVPVKATHLVAAKGLVVLVVAILGSVLAAVASVPLAFALGLTTWDGAAFLDGLVRLVGGSVLALPAVLASVIVVLLSRNYVWAVSFCFLGVLVGMLALNLSDLCYFVPWAAPTLLSIDRRALESLGLEAAELSKSAASYAVFTGAVFAGLGMALQRPLE